MADKTSKVSGRIVKEAAGKPVRATATSAKGRADPAPRPTEKSAAKNPRTPAPSKAAVPSSSGRAQAAKPALLSGGNPQIPKGDGDAPVQAYIAAMPGWKSDAGRRIDALIVRTVPNV